MSKRIDNNTSNVSILMADYNDLCIEVMTDKARQVTGSSASKRPDRNSANEC
jgi:hypothetical protein